jgi:hypothetical protein
MGATRVTPAEVTTDQAPVYSAVLEGLLPAAWHRTKRLAVAFDELAMAI